MPRADKAAKAALRTDGRVPLMVYMLPDIVDKLKQASRDDQGRRYVYEIVEEAVLAWLAAANKKKTKRS